MRTRFLRLVLPRRRAGRGRLGHLTGDAQSPAPFGIPSARSSRARLTAITAVAGSRAQGWLAQGRSEGDGGPPRMVGAIHPLASQAGLEVLRKGGNAIDAAVATGAVLDVTSQNDTGIGGDLFAIVWVAPRSKLYALNAAGRAPAGWTPEFFTQKLGQKRCPATASTRRRCRARWPGTTRC